MNGHLTLERIAKINSAVSEFKAAQDASRKAAKLVPLADQQTIMVGIPDRPGDNRCYQTALAIDVPTVRSLIRAEQGKALQRLAAATRALNQLGVEVPK